MCGYVYIHMYVCLCIKSSVPALIHINVIPITCNFKYFKSSYAAQEKITASCGRNTCKTISTDIYILYICQKT